MINWNKTFKETGYNKEYFDKYYGSSRKVYKICDKCNKGSWVEFRDSYKLCKSCSLKDRKLTNEHKEKISNANKGENHYMYNKHHSEDIKRKISESEKGKIISQEIRNKISKSSKGKKLSYDHIQKLKNRHHTLESRIKSSCTRQGIEIDEFKGFTTRNHVLPINQCIKLNTYFKGSNAHHIMSNVVIFISYELHKSIRHNMKNGKNMNEINKIAWDYLVNNKL